MTVPSLTISWAAISRLVAPEAMKRKTSISRSVRGDGDEAGNAGAARGFAEGFRGDRELAADGECAEGDYSAEERVDTENEGQEDCEAAERRHGMQHGERVSSLLFSQSWARDAGSCAIGGL